MVKVSFVCPIFNKQNYIEIVLSSLKNQIGSFNKEFIFINDGSTDSSLQDIRKKTKNWENVKILDQKNFGPAVATQNGIEISSGDYLKLVGGDDVLHPNCTNMLLEVIKKNKSVAVFSKYKLLENYELLNFRKEKLFFNKRIESPLYETVKSSFSGTSPNLYCNKTIKKYGGCNTKLFVEDFSLVLGLSMHGSFSFIDNVTSFGPKNDINRIMVGKKTQLLHDYNAALYYFLLKYENIPPRIKTIACKKTIGRAEKWGRRTKGKKFMNKMNLLKIKFFLGYSNHIEIIKNTCHYFYENLSDEAIRYKII